MGIYDGSHLGQHQGKSRELIQTAVNLLEHCKLVSAAKDRESKTKLENIKFPLIGNSFLKAKDKSSAAKVYIAQGENAIVIAFRGSGANNVKNTLKNMLADLDIILTKDRKYGFPGLVHKGFLSEYAQLRSQLIEYFSKTNYQKRGVTVYITGFSLGAALAVLCAYDLAQKYKINPHVYLFAAPAVGNHDFTRQFEQKISTVFRFAHEKDIVSQIPHCLVCEYKATGPKLLVFDNNGKQVHHDKIKLQIKVDRVAALAALSNGTRRAALLSVILKLASTFIIYHRPEYYKKKIARFHRNYNDCNQRNSDLSQAAEKQYQECQQHCLGL